jgi:uncharacterized membrane protein YkoI
MNVLWMAIVVITTGASTAENPIKHSDLPAAARRTADEQAKGATVVGYEKHTENGKTEYEVHLLVKGHTKDITIDPNGKLLEVEEQAEINALPLVVVNGLRRQAGQGNITKIESLTKHGEIVAYKAQVESDGKHREIQVGPNGERLDHEE